MQRLIIGLKKKGSIYSLFYTTPKKRIWGIEVLKMLESGGVKQISGDRSVRDDVEFLKKEYPNGARGIEAEIRSVEISKSSAGRIENALATAITNARKPDKPARGLDGVEYIFEVRSERNWSTACT